jgi:hypothetical protein
LGVKEIATYGVQWKFRVSQRAAGKRTSVPHITSGIGHQAERAETLNERAFQLIVSQRIKLARRANLAALDPLARQNTFLLDRRDRRR